MRVAEIAIAELVAAAAQVPDTYRKTEQDIDGDGRAVPSLDNPWTIYGLTNVLRIRPHADAALRLVAGRLTSCFRSPEVNTKVGGVPKSRHLEGRAIDLVPGTPADLDQAAKLILARAFAGELGPLSIIIIERGKSADGRGGKGGRLHLEWDFTGRPTPHVIEDKRF